MFYLNKVMAMLGITILITALPFTSMASTRTINSVTIDISSGIESGNDVDVNVSTDSDMYHIDKVSVTNEPDVDWADGDQPILSVYLMADDDYTFSYGLSNKDVNIRGTKGTAIRGQMSNSYLKLFIVLDDLKDKVSNYELNLCDLNVSALEWDEMHGTARWGAANDAASYQVKLYRGSSPITSIITGKEPSYDFSSYMTKAGNYSYKVRAISYSSLYGSWEKSGSLHVTSDDAAKISSGLTGPGGSGSWLSDDKGWWYRNADRSNTVNNWQYINDKWYYFNESGYMVTGWVNWKTKWYFCGHDGAMDSNTTTPDGYHVGNDGAWTGS